MNLRVKFFALIACVCSVAIFAWPQASAAPAPPQSQADETKETIHGAVVSDPYQWLEESSSARTREWISSQQAYTASLLAKRPEIAAIRAEVRKVVEIEQAERVLFRAGDYFISKKMPGQQVASLYMRDAQSGKEQLLLDPNSWTPDHSDTMELLNVSDDGKLVAYSRRHGGRDELSVHFYDTTARRDIPDVLPEARYIYWSLPLSHDGSGFFYIKVDNSGPRLYRHQFGKKVEDDQLVFGKGLGPEMIMLASLSGDGATLLIHVLHGASGAIDVYMMDLQKESSAPKPIVRGKDATFMAKAEAGHLYIHTNWNAPRGRVMVADLAHPELTNWRTLIPEGPDTIESMEVAGGKILLNYMKDAHSELRLFDPQGKPAGTVPLPGMGSVVGVEGQFESPIACFSYSSFQTPISFYAYSTSSGKLSAISSPQVPDSLSDVQVDQVWYASKDGTRVPMFVARKKNIAKDGNAPVLLYGYGGFNWAQMPTFTPEVAVWLQMGGIYAVANIRGGNEFGDAWHKAGSGLLKQNTFDDFAAAATWLVANGYTKPSRLAIQGLSNGGLLVTASITQHPELFGAAIGRYPLIDMVRYERFSIARWWTTEYGSASDPAQFKVLYSYSPYHHVKKGTNYPAVLFITGDGDTRVDPSHARKMTAMLQSASSQRPTLLLYDSKSGHSGTLSAEAEIEQTTMELAFLVWQLGVAVPR